MGGPKGVSITLRGTKLKFTENDPFPIQTLKM